jgi:hypothetical protein
MKQGTTATTLAFIISSEINGDWRKIGGFKSLEPLIGKKGIRS